MLFRSLLVGSLTAGSLYQRPSVDPAWRRWRKALRQLARRQVDCAPWETPLALLERVRTQCPELADAFHDVVDAYLQARYGNNPDYLKSLRAAIVQLQK